jgi:para-nitrobenzyl esterase
MIDVTLSGGTDTNTSIAFNLWVKSTVLFWKNSLASLTIGFVDCADLTFMTYLKTRLGEIRGIDDGKVKSFLGIRYGQSPTNGRRFLPPLRTCPWTGTLDATTYPNRAMQLKTESSRGEPIEGDMDEDCLFLNIVTPSNNTKSCPVLLWIHGGAFINGSGNEFDGSVLAYQGNVVVVTVNYRLGLFGFLDLSIHGRRYASSASNNISDLILALQWLQENIGDYGGDCNNVTIFGESSGGSAVLGLLAAPSADNLYHKAIAHSPTCPYKTLSDPTDLILKQLNVDKNEYIETLLSMPAKKLVDLKGYYGICVDGLVITRCAYEAIRDRGALGVPLLIGTNREEGTLYTSGEDEAQDHYPAWNIGLAKQTLCGGDPTKYLAALAREYPDASPGKFHEMIWTDMFRRNSLIAAELASAAGPGGWFYRFDYPANLPRYRKLGATHSCEMAFTFNLFAKKDARGHIFHDRDNPDVRRLANIWSDTIIGFARTGQPNGFGLPHWPKYRSPDRQCLIFDARPRIEADPDEIHRGLWDS